MDLLKAKRPTNCIRFSSYLNSVPPHLIDSGIFASITVLAFPRASTAGTGLSSHSPLSRPIPVYSLYRQLPFLAFPRPTVFPLGSPSVLYMGGSDLFDCKGLSHDIVNVRLTHTAHHAVNLQRHLNHEYHFLSLICFTNWLQSLWPAAKITIRRESSSLPGEGTGRAANKLVCSNQCS